MTLSEGEAHSRAVASLQALLSKHSPGSSPYRIAERALDLAFNRSRARGSLSEHDLLVEAETLIQHQVEARLIPGTLVNAVPEGYRPAPDDRRTQRTGLHRAVRSRANERIQQVQLWLAGEEHRGGSYACVS